MVLFVILLIVLGSILLTIGDFVFEAHYPNPLANFAHKIVVLGYGSFCVFAIGGYLRVSD